MKDGRVFAIMTPLESREAVASASRSCRWGMAPTLEPFSRKPSLQHQTAAHVIHLIFPGRPWFHLAFTRRITGSKGCNAREAYRSKNLCSIGTLYENTENLWKLFYKTTNGATNAYETVRFWSTNAVLNREPTMGIRHATHNHGYAVVSI